MTKSSVRPFLWLLFSAGGMLTSFFAPVLAILFCVAVPLGWVALPEHAVLHSLLQSVLVRGVLLGLCVLALFHWAYRFYHILRDSLRLKLRSRIVMTACYAGAIAGSVAAGYIIVGT